MASSIETEVLPKPVGPQITIIFGLASAFIFLANARNRAKRDVLKLP